MQINKVDLNRLSLENGQFYYDGIPVDIIRLATNDRYTSSSIYLRLDKVNKKFQGFTRIGKSLFLDFGIIKYSYGQTIVGQTTLKGYRAKELYLKNFYFFLKNQTIYIDKEYAIKDIKKYVDTYKVFLDVAGPEPAYVTVDKYHFPGSFKNLITKFSAGVIKEI